MPFVSSAQRKWMYANHPAMAKRWSEHTPKGAKLPEHVSKDHEKKALAEKVAAALQNVQLVPGAPPVKRLPVPDQAPAPQQGQPVGQPAGPGANGVPQQAQAQIPAAPTAKDALTSQQVQRPIQKHPGAVTNSEAIVAEKINKMAAAAYLKLLRNDLKDRLGR